MPTLSPVHEPEHGAWRDLDGEWRQMHGNFERQGISVERHRFRTDRALDWGRSFHADSLEICLNLQGAGCLSGPGAEATLGVRSVAFYSPAAGTLAGTRKSGAAHRFVTVEMSRGFLAGRLSQAAPESLHAGVRSFLEADPGAAPIFVETRTMDVSVQNAARALAEPPLAPGSAGGQLWYGAKVTELISLLFFAAEPVAEKAPELFCARQKRIANERVEHARALLERDLENPPTLEMLAAEAGCGAFHLSRMFSQSTGQTIPQYLRDIRLEKAARLLREGRANVTEAATAVGYQSLSHFSKAFWEKFGCCPGLYNNPKLAAVTRTRARR